MADISTAAPPAAPEPASDADATPPPGGAGVWDWRAALEFWRRVTLEGVQAEAPDLTARQAALLLTVYLDEPPHTVRGLAAALGVAKPAITRALDTLSQHGYVRRRRDASDKRNVLVQRTVTGAVFVRDFAERIRRVAVGL